MSEFVKFMEDYTRVWEAGIRTSDVTKVAAFYQAPFLSIGPDGSLTLSRNEGEIVEFLRSRLGQFQKDGATHWSFRGCDTLSLGTQAVLLCVNWEGRRADGSLARAWRQYYNVLRTSAGPKIVVSTFSAGSHG